MLHLDEPATVQAFPIETVSQSEGGFELVYQSSVVLPVWPIKGSAGETWTRTIRAELS